jgi:hypothetical protein
VRLKSWQRRIEGVEHQEVESRKRLKGELFDGMGEIEWLTRGIITVKLKITVSRFERWQRIRSGIENLSGQSLRNDSQSIEASTLTVQIRLQQDSIVYLISDSIRFE